MLRTLFAEAISAITSRPSPHTEKISFGETFGRPLVSTVANQHKTEASISVETDEVMGLACSIFVSPQCRRGPKVTNGMTQGRWTSSSSPRARVKQVLCELPPWRRCCVWDSPKRYRGSLLSGRTPGQLNQRLGTSTRLQWIHQGAAPSIRSSPAGPDTGYERPQWCGDAYPPRPQVAASAREKSAPAGSGYIPLAEEPRGRSCA